jgi:hypothetical protein
MRLPDFGYSDVTRSKVRALLCAEVGTWKADVRNYHEPAASTKDKTQGSGPVSHLCKKQPPEEVDVLFKGTHDEIAPASKSVHIDRVTKSRRWLCGHMQRAAVVLNTSRRES